MRRALPLAAGLAVAALALAGCSDDSGGAMTDGVDTGSGDVVEVPGVPFTGDSAALSPDGSRIAVPCDGELCLWSTAEGTLDDRWDGGGVVAWGTGGLVATDRVDGGTVSVVLVDDATGDEVGTAEAYDAEVVQDGPGAGMRDLEFSPDGQTLAGAGADGVVRLWSVDDPTDVTELDPEGEAPVAVAFSPTGPRSPSRPPTPRSRSSTPGPGPPSDSSTPHPRDMSPGGRTTPPSRRRRSPSTSRRR